MCYNLGAKHGISIDEQINYEITYSRAENATAHTYVAGEENVYGDLFQWGRIPDGHEKRNSSFLAYSASNGMKKDEITSGQLCPDANDILHPWLQVKKNSTWYGKFITADVATNQNWNPYYDTPSSADVLWRSGRDIRNDPCSHYKEGSTYVEFWYDGNNSDACQDAGTAWKLPSPDEWGSIYRGGTISGTPLTATANTWTWDDGGLIISNGKQEFLRPGGFKVSPDEQIITLFLPACGHRNGGNAILYNTGIFGTYWSSTAISTNTTYLNSGTNIVSPSSNRVRSYGNAVRCVKST
jgi:hypothetical protein